MLKMYEFSSEELLAELKEKNVIEIPEYVEITHVNTGELDNGAKWATLNASSVEELDTLRSVKLEDRAGVIKVSIKGYKGEDVNKFIGNKIKTDKFTVDFDVKGKYKQITGAKFICPDIKLLNK